MTANHILKENNKTEEGSNLKKKQKQTNYVEIIAEYCESHKKL